MKFEIEDTVQVLNMEWSHRNSQIGKVYKIYPAGMFHEKAIIQVDHGEGHHGQYTEDQLVKIS